MNWKNYHIDSVQKSLDQGHFDSVNFEKIQPNGEELFHSMFDCIDDFLPIEKGKKTFKGYQGPHKPAFDRIIFDFDDKDNLEKAYNDALNFIRWLDVEVYDLCFSGNKGFHVVIPAKYFPVEPCNNYYLILKKVTQYLKKELFPTLDDSIMSTPYSKIRWLNSYNVAGKRYKTIVDETMSLEEILEYSKTQHNQLYSPIPKNINPALAFQVLLNKLDLMPKQSLIEGRHNYLLKIVMAKYFDGQRLDEKLYKEIYDADIKKHGDKSWFNDKKEKTHGKGFEAVKPFVDSIWKNLEKKFLLAASNSLRASPNDLQNESAVSKFYKKTKNGGWSLNEKAYVDYFKEKFNLIYKDTCFYVFTGKYYKRISDDHVKYLINEAAPEVPALRQNSIFQRLKIDFFREDNFLNKKGLLNLNNGILNLEKEELLPHSSEYFFTYCLNHNYDKNAQCPTFIQFLNFILEERQDAIDVVQQIFGYLIDTEENWLHKAFVLYGEGRNGKSTLLKIIENLIGFENISSVSLADFHKPFSLIHLHGKLVNIKEEAPSDSINAEVFKDLIAGGNVIAAHKGKDEIVFPCKTKFIFACNKMPLFKENSTAILDRLYFLDFNKYISEEEKDPFILQKIISSELSGVLNFALEGYKKIKQQMKISLHENSKKLLEEYQLDSNSVFSFIKDEVVFTERETFTTFVSFYERYKNYCKEGNFKQKSMRTFSREFKSIITNKNQFKLIFKIELTSDMLASILKRNHSAKGYYHIILKTIPIFSNPQDRAYL